VFVFSLVSALVGARLFLRSVPLTLGLQAVGPCSPYVCPSGLVVAGNCTLDHDVVCGLAPASVSVSTHALLGLGACSGRGDHSGLVALFFCSTPGIKPMLCVLD
jgi:hypothetical protein